MIRLRSITISKQEKTISAFHSLPIDITPSTLCLTLVTFDTNIRNIFCDWKKLFSNVALSELKFVLTSRSGFTLKVIRMKVIVSDFESR